MRKRGCFVLSFLLFLGVGAFCQEFDRIVDFEKTLKELSIEAAERPVGKVPPGKYLILEGLVSERWVIDPEPQTFIGEIELVGGEWIGVEAVEMWNCIVQFTGPEFASRIPAGRTKDWNMSLSYQGHSLKTICSLWMIFPCASTVARSITFFNSLTFPGQW